MNGTNCLVDTNILIHLQNGVKQIVEFINDKFLFISFVTELELLSHPNLTKADEVIVRSMINDCILIDINERIKKETIRIRRKHKIKLPDAIVAASAICFDLPLITCDKGFRIISGLNIILIDI